MSGVYVPQLSGLSILLPLATLVTGRQATANAPGRFDLHTRADRCVPAGQGARSDHRPVTAAMARRGAGPEKLASLARPQSRAFDGWNRPVLTRLPAYGALLHFDPASSSLP
jgi:hypothetical protein